MDTEQILDSVRFLQEQNMGLIKQVIAADTHRELAESFRTMLTLRREFDLSILLHCNGNSMVDAACCDGFTKGDRMI